MGEPQLQKVQSLRFAAPNVYQTMVETFKKFNIHPYDAQGTIIATKEGFDITIKSVTTSSEIAKISISREQAKKPDEKVNNFFEEAAEKCKSQLITDYFKMIKL